MHLLALPYDVIERIIFWSCNLDHTRPPAPLISLALTCSVLYNHALSSQNPHPLAHIARFRYSTAAPTRRFGQLTDTVLAAELKIRCSALHRVRARAIYGPHIIADLWLILFMCWEDDGYNREQLEAADAGRWVADIIHRRGREQTDLWGWPVETELLQVAVQIYAILAPTSPSVPDILYYLQPFSLAAHRYPIALLPETLYTISSATLAKLARPTPSDPSLTIATTPIQAPTLVPRPLWGRSLLLSRPPLAGSSILASCPPPANSAVDSTRFDTDFHRLVLAHLAVTQKQHPYPFLTTLTPSPLTDMILSACWVGPGRLWAPGMFSGVWEGGCNIPHFAWYTDMLTTHPHMPSFAFGEQGIPDSAYQPLRLSIREHVCTDLTGFVGTGASDTGDGIQNAWFPEGEGPDAFYLRERGDELAIHDPREPDPAYALKHYRTVGACGESSEGLNDDVNIELNEMMRQEVISRAEGEEDMDVDVDENEVPPRIDVIITGETGEEHAVRWGAYTIYGRVRRNDGFVVFVRVPRDPAWGRWVFRAYLTGNRTLVGRWREKGMSLDVAGYEGAFVLRRVESERGV